MCGKFIARIASKIWYDDSQPAVICSHQLRLKQTLLSEYGNRPLGVAKQERVQTAAKMENLENVCRDSDTVNGRG